jgi:hypothetical protein
MKPWTLIGSTAGRPGIPGLADLLNGGWSQVSASWPLAASGPTCASRRSCRAAQSGRLFPATTLRVPANMLPPTPIVVATPEWARPLKRSNGGS